MKRILGFMALTAVTLMLMPACKDDLAGVDPGVNDGSNITLDGTAATRSWSEECYPFKLYTFQQGTAVWGGTPIINGAESFYVIADHKITTSRPWPTDGSKMRFVGVMRTGDGGASGSAHTTVSVDANGDFELLAGDGDNNDMLLSNNLTAGKNDTDKKMSFRHVMAQLVIELQADPSITGVNQVTGTIAAGKTKGMYNAFAADANTLATGGEAAYNIGLDNTLDLDTPGEETATVIHYLVPDGSLVEKLTNVEVNGVEVGDVQFVDENDDPASFELKPGVSYTLTLVLNTRGISNAILSLGAWNQETITGEAEANFSDKRINVKWDPAGADVTSLELVGTDKSVFTASVVKEDDGEGYAEGATEISMTIAKVYGYYGDTRVEMTVPEGHTDAGDRLWAFTDATIDAPAEIELQRVLIATSTQLKAIDNGSGAGLAKHHCQVSDVDMSTEPDWYPIGKKTDARFKGSYVGGGYKIHNFTNTTIPATSVYGLFGYNEGLIADVHVASGNIKGGRFSGVICARNQAGGLVRDCINEANITAFDYAVGGVIGINIEGKVIGCINKGTATIDDSAPAKYYLGGVIGWNYTASVEKCINYGTVTAKDSYVYGGVIGASHGTAADIVSECANYGTVNADYVSTVYRYGIGGVIGRNTLTTVTKCANYGNITGDRTYYIGGVVGFNGNASDGTYGGRVEECKNHGEVTVANRDNFAEGGIGGVVGYNYYGTVTKSTNHVENTGYDRIGGIVGIGRGGEVFDCHNYSKRISGRRVVAGVVGLSSDGLVYDCTNEAAIYVDLDCAGGIVGNFYITADGYYIKNCVNRGAINNLASDPSYTDETGTSGGICGNASGPVISCQNYGVVKSDGGQVGGIAGHGNGYIENCTNRAAVTGLYQVGGLVGALSQSMGSPVYVLNSKNYAKVTGTESLDPEDGWLIENCGGIGGLIGSIHEGYIKNSHNEGTVEGQWNVAGIVARVTKATIDNVTNTAAVKGNRNVGGLVGYAEDLDADEVGGTITNLIANSTNSGKISTYGGDSQGVGGIAGVIVFTDIENCENTAAVSGGMYVGGLVGHVDIDYSGESPYATVRNSTNKGTVTGSGSSEEPGSTYTGGIVGYNRGLIEDCENIAAAKVSGSGDYVGGIAGSNEGRISMNVNRADVNSKGNHTGGIAGANNLTHSLDLRGYITNHLGIIGSRNTGDVYSNGGDYVGGIAGSARSSVYASYNTGDVEGSSRVGGLVGYVNDDEVYSWDDQPEIKLVANYNTGDVTGEYEVGGLIGRLDNWTYVTDEVMFLVQACYTTGTVEGWSEDGILIGIIMSDDNNSQGIAVTNCYWGPSPGASDEVNDIYNSYGTVITVSDNFQFSGSDWPSDDDTLNWGEGNDPGNGYLWSTLGSSGSTSYPKLYWE